MNVQAGEFAIIGGAARHNAGRVVRIIRMLGREPVWDGHVWHRGRGPCWLVTSAGFGSPLMAADNDADGIIFWKSDIMPIPDEWVRNLTRVSMALDITNLIAGVPPKIEPQKKGKA